ncbi:MAG: hypothetical protein AAFQ44_01450 [Pseudomonadota bacterium]
MSNEQQAVPGFLARAKRAVLFALLFGGAFAVGTYILGLTIAVFDSHAGPVLRTMIPQLVAPMAGAIGVLIGAVKGWRSAQ